jgi:hypothetical protein
VLNPSRRHDQQRGDAGTVSADVNWRNVTEARNRAACQHCLAPNLLDVVKKNCSMKCAGHVLPWSNMRSVRTCTALLACCQPGASSYKGTHNPDSTHRVFKGKTLPQETIVSNATFISEVFLIVHPSSPLDLLHTFSSTCPQPHGSNARAKLGSMARPWRGGWSSSSTEARWRSILLSGGGTRGGAM